MAELEEGNADPSFELPAVKLIGQRLQLLERQIQQIGPQVAKALTADENFLPALAQLLIRSDSVQSAIAAVGEVPVREALAASMDGAGSEVGAALTDVALVTEQQDSPEVVHQDSPEAVPPAAIEPTVIDPELLMVYPQVSQSVKYGNIIIESVTLEEAAAVAVIRHDSAHPLFPSQVIFYLLMQNDQTKVTFWQNTPDIRPDVRDGITLAMANIPDNVYFRCKVHNVEAPPA